MDDEAKIHTVLVFVNDQNQFGNPVGIVIDEQRKLNNTQRQTIAKKLDYSETVFINDLKIGYVDIFNPIQPVKFAGHALVGSAWFINEVNKKPISSLICSDEIISARHDNFTWIKAPLNITPPWNQQQMKDSHQVENLTVSEIKSYKHTVVWAWLDRDKNLIRARTFAPDWGIPEDQANGSGSMQLAAKFNTRLTIIHGKGSIIYVKPIDESHVELGGRCFKL